MRNGKNKPSIHWKTGKCVQKSYSTRCVQVSIMEMLAKENETEKQKINQKNVCQVSKVQIHLY